MQFHVGSARTGQPDRLTIPSQTATPLPVENTDNALNGHQTEIVLA